MKKIINFKKNHPVIFSLITVLVLDVCLVAIKGLCRATGILQSGSNTDYLIREFFVLCVAIVFVFVTGQQHIYKCGTKIILKGLWSGFVFFVLAVIGGWLFIEEAVAAGRELKPAWEIAAFVIFLIFVGAAEESVSRGIISDVLIERFGKSGKGIWLAAVLSGVIFGFSHITNVLSQSAGETVVQMIATSMTGTLFSAIYIRHRNIFVPMILHSVFDFMTMCSNGLFVGGSVADNVAAENFEFFTSLGQALQSQSLFVIIALFILRPKVLRKIAERNRENAALTKSSV